LNQALAAISKGDLDLIFGPFGPTKAFWSEIRRNIKTGKRIRAGNHQE
jgi:hypothetical protein